jgi:dolichol-phosphate mannosyltransferase
MKTLIVIPTYKEKENITRIIALIKKADKKIHILVVDDNSPDGRAQAVRALRKRDETNRLLERPGMMGLGTAYVAGFKYALEKKYDYIFEMDADFSHDPKYLPDFFREIKKYDLVVGSRYVNGVSVINWPLRRLMLSKMATMYVRFITGLPMTDTTSGFKCYRRKVLQSIDLDKIHSDGYAFQIEMHHKAWRRGFNIKEIPIIFIDRHSGSSKMSRGIVGEALLIVWKLRLGIIK